MTSLLKKIVDIQLERVRKRVESKGVLLSFSPGVKRFLVEHGFDPHYGARPLKRAIQNYLLNGFAQDIIAGRIRAGDSMSVECKGDKIEFVKNGRVPKHEKARQELAAVRS